MTEKPSLADLEQLVARRQNAEALQLALDILQSIDIRRGGLGDIAAGATYPGGSEEDTVLIFATRFAAAFGRLMTEQDLKISSYGYERLSAQHRWIELIFALSGFRNSDNFITQISNDAGSGRISFQGANLLRLLVILTLNSFIDIDFDLFWRANSAASAVAFLNYLSSRYVFTRRAFEFRERLLEWIPARLAAVKLGSVTLSRMQEFYLFCSYAVTDKKHEIKRSLIEQMRRACLEAGVVESTGSIPAPGAGRATLVVVAEAFVQGHATFRCFSTVVQSLRGRFNLVGVVYPDPTGTPIADHFDECIGIPAGDFLASVRSLAAQIVARKPALILYLGVGMMTQVIALASLRLAPIQCASIGHNASTMSPTIDYFILPEDWVASRECFSEKVIALPKGAMPFLRLPATKFRRKPSDNTVRVAIPASMMKLNPVLLDAISRVAAGAKAHAEFHFFPNAIGLPFFELSRIVSARIPGAAVHPQSSYERYMEFLAQCDLFLSPFPHGGMTSIMDTFQLGMPGVCLDGTEPHAHADAALFARIGLPNELVTRSVDEYVAAAIRLIDDGAWRRHCTEIVRDADLDATFFKGDAALFRKAIENLIWPAAT
jgi:hypothetical protein